MLVSRTCSIDKCVVVFHRQYWIRQVAEELLQKASDTIDIVIEVLRVSEVKRGIL